MNCIKKLILVNMFIMLISTCVIAKEIQTFNHDELLSEYERSDDIYQKYVSEGLPYRIMYKDYMTGKITYEYFNCDASEYENNNEETKVKKPSKKKKKKKDVNISETETFNYNEIVNNYNQEIINQNNEEKNVGWVQFNGVWYYQDEQGNNKSGWQYIVDKWYYFDPETYIMVTGLKEINGNKYYFNNDGNMLVDCWMTIDSKNYYFDSDGHMIKNERRKGQDGKNYYFDGNGVSVIINEFFNDAYNADSLNSLRDNCTRYYNNYTMYGNIYLYSFKGALETYESVLNQSYKIDMTRGNQKGMEEERKAFTEIQEWLR